MADNTPPTIPKEPASWKGAVLSIAVHLALFGGIWWVAMPHGSGSPSAKVDQPTSAPGLAGANAVPAIPSVAPSAIKPVAADAQAGTMGAGASTARNEDHDAPKVEANPPPQAILSEAKHVHPKKPINLVENRKSIEEKRKKHKSELAIAKLQAKQKAEALAQKKKQKQKEAEEAELLAKKRAAENALKIAAESQKRKEQQDKQTMERLHQEEMQRIKNSLSGNS